MIANNDISDQHIKMCELLFSSENFVIPVEYLFFIGKFGEGLLGDCVRIFPINKMFQKTTDWREAGQTKAEILFFSKKKNERKNCVVVGDAFKDQLIFHLNGEYFFSSLYYTEKIYQLGKTLLDAFEFFKNHNTYGKNDMTHFVPFDSSL